MDLRTQHYALDRGLDGTTLHTDTVPLKLPEQSFLVPPQGRYPAQLQQLLDKPDLGDFLANHFIKPQGDAALSGPAQFATALENAQAELLALLPGQSKLPVDRDGSGSSSDGSGHGDGATQTLMPTLVPGSKPAGLAVSPGNVPSMAAQQGSGGADQGTALSSRAGTAATAHGALGVQPTLHPKTARVIQRARRVLERESGLRADLASYRAALLKG